MSRWAGSSATPRARVRPPLGRAMRSPGRRSGLDRIREDVPGEQWRDLFGSTWPAYCSWYLSGDADERLSLHEARRR